MVGSAIRPKKQMKRIRKKIRTEVTISRKTRLRLFAGGLLLIVVGVLRIEQGRVVVLNWMMQPNWQFGVVAAGILFVILALLPSAIFNRASE
jgi:hypothetical protein